VRGGYQTEVDLAGYRRAMHSFGDVVASETELRAVIPAPRDGSPPLRKQIDHLDDHCRDFIARSPLFMLATADDQGRCDVSPRGGPPGFVGVLDRRRLLVPDFPGNRRLDSQTNLLANPRASLLFLVPGLGETLRVEGAACITRDSELLAEVAVNGRAPALGIGIEVEAAFIHCAKALIRSGAWKPDTWADELPSASKILRDHMAIPNLTEAEVAERLADSYEKTLY
jgi:uncharacterized protein